MPVEIRLCVMSMFLFVMFSVCNAVMAAEFVRRLDMLKSLQEKL
jgi:hypothetical protein